MGTPKRSWTLDDVEINHLLEFSTGDVQLLPEQATSAGEDRGAGRGDCMGEAVLGRDCGVEGGRGRAGDGRELGKKLCHQGIGAIMKAAESASKTGRACMDD